MQPFPGSPKPIAVWRRTAGDLVKQIGRPVLDNGPLAVALGGVALYLIGVVRMMGILRAERVSIARGLPLVQLQDYLLRGLSVVARPKTIVVLTMLMALVTVTLAVSNLRKENPEATVRKADSSLLLMIGVVVIFMVAASPVAEWLSVLPGIFVSIYCLVKLNQHHTKNRQAGFSIGVLVGFALSLGLHAYYDPPPLDHVVIHETNGLVREGRLLYQTGSVLYLVGHDDPASGYSTVEVVPMQTAQGITIQDGVARNYKTVPELLGLNFYRLWEDDNAELHFEPSP